MQDGVNASHELQIAARRVEEENRRLKALLRAKGVSEREIDGFADNSPGASSEGSALARVQEERRPYYAEARSLSTEASKDAPSLLHNASTQNPQSPYRPYPAPLNPSMTCPPTLDDSTYHPLPRGQDQTPTPAWSGTAALASQIESSAIEAETSDSRLSCEYAASIITGMKYDASALQVKRELGCGENLECKVEHAALFEVMDRYSGD